MNFTRPFSSLTKSDTGIAGGKGASLGEMLNAGIPVPDGFVVLSTTFDEFLAKADLVQEIEAILGTVDNAAIHSVDSASEKIQNLIKYANMSVDIADEILEQFTELDSEFVAVRSSATAEDGADHAWAGQLESYLNTKKEAVLEKVQECWASLFTPRAIFYRFEKGLHETKISVAVVIQSMVNSEKSGIAFSVHPVTEDHNQLIIEAGLGLGEAIVSGSVTPDSYVVEKEPRRILDINIANQTKALYRKHDGGNEWNHLDPEQAAAQVLTETQILELSETILRIENHYGFPCDIEWAFEAGKFYIVQSRPITTLSVQGVSKIILEKEYTRDTTIIMQEAWGICCGTYIKELLGKGNPYRPGIIHYMNQGSIEIWENKKSTQWLMDAILEMNISDPSLLPRIMERYEETIQDIKVYWKDEYLKDISLFPIFFELVKKALGGFIPYYYSAVDDRTPEALRAMALKLRDEDTFFATNDVFIRDTLTHHYPEIIGYETSVFSNEVIDIPELSILKERRNNMTLIDGVERAIETLKELSSRKPELQFVSEKPVLTGNELFGQTAFKGIVTGTVRILRRRDQVSEVQEGDIIVSPMTTPDFMPAMQKASAFITDEGGITCHAAIVARELGKPCIIGTKFATEVLRDGDKVEVDADNGMVKILSSNEPVVFEKNYVRDNSLMSFEIWNRNQTKNVGQKFFMDLMSFILDSHNGVTTVYYKTGIWDDLAPSVTKAMSDPEHFDEIVKEYDTALQYLEPLWKANKAISREDFIEFIKQSVLGWTGMSIGYDIPNIKTLTDEQKAFGLSLREKGIEYFENMDHIVQATLRSLYPELGNLIRYISLEEFESDKIPTVKQLEARENHFIYFKDTLYTDISFEEWKKQHPEVKVIEEKPEASSYHELKGTTAMKGFATGIVRVVMSKSELERVQEGDILVTSMTTPDFLPAMHKAAAFVTDEGGITCHAAIVAREIGKPCVIGTKFATQVLKDGDMLEVDANTGIVTKIS